MLGPPPFGPPPSGPHLFWVRAATPPGRHPFGPPQVLGAPPLRTPHNEHPTPQKKNWPNAVWPNRSTKKLAKFGQIRLANCGLLTLAKCGIGQMRRMAKSGLAKCGHFRRVKGGREGGGVQWEERERGGGMRVLRERGFKGGFTPEALPVIQLGPLQEEHLRTGPLH